jgi:hypothetical protein
MSTLVNDKISEANKDKKEVAKKIPQVRKKFIENSSDLKLKKKLK